jgi:membrane-associated phospholipid phosphatase
VQRAPAPAARVSQPDPSAATGLHPVSTATPPPVKVEPPHAEPQPSASSSTSAALALTPGCTDLSGRHAVPCPARTHAAVATAATRGPDAGSGAAAPGVASSAAVEPEPVSPPPNNVTYRSPERALVRNLVSDQKAIWGSPLRIRLDHVQWLVPLLAGTALVIGSDRGIESHVPTSASFRKQSNSFSNYGVAGFAGITGATWLWGLSTHNDHMRETGVLAGEAALDSLALTYAIKSITQRDRPDQGNGHGNFWSNGDSFPSEHASAAWSVATVFAHEYPGPLPKLLAYGGAAAISAARVAADKHFASDALVGSAIGYFIGRQVYKAHHDQGMSDAAYGTFERTRGAEGPRDPAHMGSTYVELDSWVYPAFDRLVALGYAPTAFLMLRPWTRLECARIVRDFDRSGTFDLAQPDVHGLFASLEREFEPELRRLTGDVSNYEAAVESIYTRFTGISGPPLTDSFHFGQSLYNDFGRRFQSGFNAVSGMSARAVAGPFAFYVRGEYQRAPGADALPEAARNAIAALDILPVPPNTPIPPTNRFRLLDAYVGVNLSGWQLSFGKQSLWWSSNYGGNLMFTNNAEPATMIRLTRVSPFQLPGFLGRLLGPIRTDSIFGQLGGQRFVRQPPDYTVLTGTWTSFLPLQPYLHGEKISLKPTPNLDIGVSLTAVFSGSGVPLTFGAFRNTFHNYSTGNTDNGDRRTGFEFRYRIPKLRNWLTLYNDSMAEDEPNPVAYPRRSAMNPGVYLSHVPGVPKLDFRVEGVYTDLPGLLGRAVWYSDKRYRSGYSNYGNIMGSWVGPQGKAVQAWSKYWFAPDRTVQIGYRYAAVSEQMIPNGGSLYDVSLKFDWMTKSRIGISGMLQQERWAFPVLSPTRQNDFTVQFEVKWYADKLLRFGR